METEYSMGGQMMSSGFVRVLHAVPDAPRVDVYANNQLIARNLAYGAYTDYMMVPADNYMITIFAAGTRTNPVLSSMLTLEADQDITAVAAGRLNSLKLLAIVDADVPIVPDKALVRFIHLSPNAPAVDITLPNGTKLFSNVSFEKMTDYIAVDPMMYTLQVRAAGTDTVVLTVPGVAVQGNKYYTIYAIGLVGANPPLKALLLEDGAEG